jgi:hypothetical protein
VADARVVVDQLVAGRQVQAVERTLAAFRAQDHVEVGARQRPAQGEGVRRETTAAVLPDLDGADVERPLALPLYPVIIEHGIFRCHHLRHRVRKVHAFGAVVTLDDARPAVRAGHDQTAAVPHERSVGGGRDEDEINRFLDGRPRGDVHERPVAEEGGVQGGEGVALVIGQTGQARLDQGRVPD